MEPKQATHISVLFFLVIGLFPSSTSASLEFRTIPASDRKRNLCRQVNLDFQETFKKLRSAIKTDREIQQEARNHPEISQWVDSKLILGGISDYRDLPAGRAAKFSARKQRFIEKKRQSIVRNYISELDSAIKDYDRSVGKVILLWLESSFSRRECVSCREALNEQYTTAGPYDRYDRLKNYAVRLQAHFDEQMQAVGCGQLAHHNRNEKVDMVEGLRGSTTVVQ